jgi:hypothetical protein
MSRKEKKYHFIYKTTDIRNGNFYIGIHSTDNLDDGYIGSGARLKHLIYKHGKKIFNMEILEFLPDRKSLKEREIEIVNTDLLLEEKCMNLKSGGYGGFNNETHQFKCSQAAGLKHSERLKTDEEYRKKRSKQISESNKKRIQKGELKSWKENYDWTGKKHTTETLQKMKESKKGHGIGEQNSQYGTKWITNSEINSKIKKDEPLPEGWRYGYVRN